MGLDKKVTFRKLDALWAREDLPVLETRGRRYFVISDLHLGDGTEADNCCGNKDALLYALGYYRSREYELILAGDVEELWQFDLGEIRHCYDGGIYREIQRFGADRVHRIFGNHDIDWRQDADPIRAFKRTMHSTEAVKLADGGGRARILVLHGHQGDRYSDTNQWTSRWAVRLYRNLEPVAIKLGIQEPPDSCRSSVVKDYEAKYYDWAKRAAVMVICGHSHRAIHASVSYIERLEREIAELEARRAAVMSGGAAAAATASISGSDVAGKADFEAAAAEIEEQIREKRRQIKRDRRRGMKIKSVEENGARPAPLYFNAGCCVYEDGLTGFEIADGEIRLTKWDRADYVKGPRYFQVGRLADYWG